MPGAVALKINSHRQAGNVNRKDLYMDCKCRSPAAVSHRPDTKFIYPFKYFLFQLLNFSIRVRLSNLTKQGFLGQQQRLFGGPAYTDADDERRTGITAGFLFFIKCQKMKNILKVDYQ